MVFPNTRGLGRVTCSALSREFALPNKRKIKRNYYFYAVRSSKNQNYHFPFKILLLSEIYPINIHFEKNRALDILNGRRLIAKMLNKKETRPREVRYEIGLFSKRSRQPF